MSDIIANKGSISGSIVSSGEINSGTIGIGGKSLHGGSVSRNAGGTYEYPVLRDKPKINGEELVGDKSTEELKIAFSKTTAEWEENPSLVSIKNAVYIYTDYKTVDGVNLPGLKIGDGLAYVVDLPFVTAEDTRITSDDIANWNNKVAVILDGETVIFYT